MSEIAFNNFGYAAKLNTKIDPFILSSRYFHQIDLKPLVLKHIIKRLAIKYSDIVFDIGCNVGTHLIPISFLCKKVYGNDHIDCLKTLKNNFQYKILKHSKNDKYLFGPTRIDILIKKI